MSYFWKHVNSLGYIPTDQRNAQGNLMQITGDGQLYVPNGIVVGSVTEIVRDVKTTDVKRFAVTDNILNFTGGSAFTFPVTSVTQKGRQITIINGTNANISIAPTNTTETIYRNLTPGSRWRASSNGVKWMVGL